MRKAAKRSSGCGSLVLTVLAVAVLIGGGAFAFSQMKDKAPSVSEMKDSIPSVCTDGAAIDGVPAYERGSSKDLGAMWSAGDKVPSAVSLQPNGPNVFGQFEAVRVVLCVEPTGEEETMPCDFIGNGGPVTIQWTSKTVDEVRIVEVATGKELHKATFETVDDECPENLVLIDGKSSLTRPEGAISKQARAIAAAFHAG